MTHPAALPADELLRECSVERTRRSGPGGQHRNKVETAIVLTHRPTSIQAEASERRSQPENQAVAVFRLRLKLAVEFRQSLDPSPSPSPLWQSRCRQGRLHINPAHDDFPTLLAEALDWLATYNWDLSDTASRLGCSATQLSKFLQGEPRAFATLNQERVARQLRPLKPG